MSNRPSRAALEERGLRLAPSALDVVEGILADSKAQVLCKDCEINVVPICPNCGKPLKVAEYSKLHLDAAQHVLGSAGLGPVQRQRVEKSLPVEPRALFLELRHSIAELEPSEQALLYEDLIALGAGKGLLGE